MSILRSDILYTIFKVCGNDFETYLGEVLGIQGSPTEGTTNTTKGRGVDLPNGQGV